MKALNKSLLIMALIMIIGVFADTASADTKNAPLSLTLGIYDDEMMLIEEINEDELTSSYSKYTYPLGTKYIRVITNTDDVADQIDITINGDKYKDNPYENISTSQQCYITIVVTDNTNDKETEYNIQLDRSALARDNTITTLSWSIYDIYGNSLPTKDILMLEEGVEYELPFMVNQISLDYFVTANDYATVSVILENGNKIAANSEPIMVDTSKNSTTVYVEGQIDDAFTTYSLTFNKALEASGDNSLVSLDVEGYSESDYFTPAVVTVTEGTSEYSAIVSKEVTEFCIYPHASHVMASVVVNAEGVTEDENGIKYFPLAGAASIVTVDVTAENGETQTYNISVLKEKDTTQVQIPTQPDISQSFFQQYMWFIIAGVVILIAVGVVVFMQVRKNRY